MIVPFRFHHYFRLSCYLKRSQMAFTCIVQRPYYESHITPSFSSAVLQEDTYFMLAVNYRGNCAILATLVMGCGRQPFAVKNGPMRGGSLSRTDISALFLRRGDELLMLWQYILRLTPRPKPRTSWQFSFHHQTIFSSGCITHTLPIPTPPNSLSSACHISFFIYVWVYLMWVDSVVHHKNLV